MRVLLGIVACGCVGVTIGFVQAWGEFDGKREFFEPHRGRNGREAIVAAAAHGEGMSVVPLDGSKVSVVNGETHDFGSSEKGVSGEHQFLFKNEGTRTLRIEAGGTSCAVCTVSSLPKTEIEPGETVPVTVKWNPSAPETDFRKEAYILTSDPQRPSVVLVVKGRIVESIRVNPDELTLGNIAASSSLAMDLRITCQLKGPVSLIGHEFTNPETAEFFSVQWEPMSRPEAERSNAESGFHVSVKIKPGLPLGPIVQTLRLKTDQARTSQIDVPIRGHVVSDISILTARNFDGKTNVLTLGLVKRGTVAKATLPIMIKGPHRDQVEMSVAATNPATSLKASVGEAKSINEGAVRMIPLTVEVPADSPRVNMMGGTEQSDFGVVLLHTTHPEVKQVKILVKFAVE